MATVKRLKEAGIAGAAVDNVAFYDKPFLKFERLLETYLAFALRGFTQFRKAMPIWIQEKLFQKDMLKKSLADIDPALGDEQRLTQVLLNLVGNAIKFTDAGEVRVSASSANSHFAVSVTDTGPGIPEEHQARIFEHFHQVDSSLTKAKGGTGLGLAIAKEIVEMHGGRIWVESTIGKGSTFRMELPIRAEFRKSAA